MDCERTTADKGAGAARRLSKVAYSISHYAAVLRRCVWVPVMARTAGEPTFEREADLDLVPGPFRDDGRRPSLTVSGPNALTVRRQAILTKIGGYEVGNLGFGVGAELADDVLKNTVGIGYALVLPEMLDP